MRRVIDEAAERFGRLDVLFNNAGGPTAGNVADITAENVDYGVKLLFTSVVLGMRYAVPHMLAAGGGSIINNSSVAAIRHLQGNILYSARESRRHPLLEARRRGTRPARDPRQRHLPRRHRHTHLLGRAPHGPTRCRTRRTNARWRSSKAISPRRIR